MPELLNHKIIGTGQPLIILHGLFGSLDNWVSLGKRFGEQFQVVLVDQRNHGKSFHDSRFSYDTMANDLDELIEHLKLENPILLGHSMGGKTVMQYCAFNPEKVEKLIVADIGPKQYPVHHDQIIKGLKKVPLSQVEKREAADGFLSDYIPEIGIRSFLLKNLKRGSNGGFEWKMNLNVIAANIEEVGVALDYYLPIEMPTLFLRGGNSNYILDSDIEDIEDIFPNSEVQTVDNAGHWLHAEQPDGFYEKVIRFIS